MPMLIATPVLRGLERAAQHSGNKECMGLLTSRSGETTITGAFLLDSVNSTCSAEAAPVAIKRASLEIRDHGHIARGIWHKHPDHHVRHSSVDEETIRRLLPAMAPANCRCIGAPLQPAVTGPNEAFLPVENGRRLVFRLAPRQAESLLLDGELSWSRIQFRHYEAAAPRATHFDGRLELVAGGSLLSLDYPETARLTSTVDAGAGPQVAELFSVIVTSRGEYEGKSLVVAEVGGEIFLRLADAEILSVSVPAQEGLGGRFLALVDIESV